MGFHLCSRVLESSPGMILFEERRRSKIQKCFVKAKEEFEDIQIKKGNNRPETPFPFYPATYNVSHSLKVNFNGGAANQRSLHYI